MPTKQSAPTLIDDALYLREHLDFDGGCHLIGKYSKKPPPLIDRIAATQVSLHQPTELGAARISSTVRLSQQSRGGLEGILQDVARGVYTRGEKWTVGRAVRDVVGEVRKNVQGLQSRTSDLHSSTLSNAHGLLDDSSTSAVDLLEKIETLQLRNKSLAKMLESAVDELWRQQKDSVTNAIPEEERTKASTMAIARVQLVQVYLEDMTLPLPSEEDFAERRHNASSGSNAKMVTDSTKIKPNLADENSRAFVTNNEETVVLNHRSVEQIRKREAPQPLDKPLYHTPGPRLEPDPLAGNTSSLVETATQRPPLAQSSFSYMLGQDSSATGMATGPSIAPRTTFLSSSTFSMLNETSRARGDVGFLFGDSDDGGGKARRGSAVKGKDKALTEADDEAFKLATWKGRRKQ